MLKEFGDFKIGIASDGTFKLDGGAMFGIIPRPLWEKVYQHDESNRILLGLNILVIKTRQYVLLCEAGIGTRYTAKEIEIFDIRHPPNLVDSLKEMGIVPEGVNFVILTHLHFDHAGGIVAGESDNLSPVFPNAKYIVQASAFKEAFEDNDRTKGSFRPQDLLFLRKKRQLKLVESRYKVCPGVKVYKTGGHCKGHQIILFESKGAKGVFVGDIIPTAKHIKPAWVMGYDLYPHRTCQIKKRIIKDAINEKWLVVFPHELESPMCFLRQGEKTTELISY